jgi:hypothetical protein
MMNSCSSPLLEIKTRPIIIKNAEKTIPVLKEKDSAKYPMIEGTPAPIKNTIGEPIALVTDLSADGLSPNELQRLQKKGGEHGRLQKEYKLGVAFRKKFLAKDDIK